MSSPHTREILGVRCWGCGGYVAFTRGHRYRGPTTARCSGCGLRASIRFWLDQHNEPNPGPWPTTNLKGWIRISPGAARQGFLWIDPPVPEDLL